MLQIQIKKLSVKFSDSHRDLNRCPQVPTSSLNSYLVQFTSHVFRLVLYLTVSDFFEELENKGKTVGVFNKGAWSNVTVYSQEIDLLFYKTLMTTILVYWEA